MQTPIALLEDDAAQGQLIKRTLLDMGYDCTLYTQGNDLLSVLAKKSFDFILLDWEVPDLTGLDVLRWIRAHQGYATPVMFITSRTREDDIVVGLQAGADDYMTKPIRTNELIARVAALLRRHTVTSLNEDQTFTVGVYQINPAMGVISLNKQAIELAPKEYDLALLFFRNPGRLFSRDVLSQSVWNRNIPATSRTLDTHLSNVRRKLHLRPENGVRLHASYALGYRLELLPEAS